MVRKTESLPQKVHLVLLKGTVSWVFCFRFFSWIIFPQVPENNTRSFRFFRKFPEIFASQGAPPVSMTLAANFATSSAGVVDTGGKLTLVSTTPAANLAPVPMTPVGTMGTISDWGTWRKKFIYICANSTVLLIFHLPPVTTTPHRWCTLSCEYLREFSKKFETALMSGAWGKLIHVENLKSKISLHCPFKHASDPCQQKQGSLVLPVIGSGGKQAGW